MADDKTKTDNRDRSKVAADEDYEVQYLMQKTKVTAAQARGLIRTYGNDRATLEREAKKLV